MRISCLEINSSTDIHHINLSLGRSFNVEAASCDDLSQEALETFSSYLSNEIVFKDIEKSLGYFDNVSADFIILNQSQVQNIEIVDSAIVLGKKGQALHLLEFNSDSLKRILTNA